MDTESKFVAPYVPFSTFETALDKLAALGGTIPPKIDHTVFPSMGGLQKGQVISAFKFLGLIDANAVPTAALEGLTRDKEGRKAAIRKLIKERYTNITEADLAGMSPGHLDVKLGDKTYNVTGTTKIKARTFLLKAAEFSGIPLSKLLTAKGPRGPRKGGKRAASRVDRVDQGKPIYPEPKQHQAAADEKVVQLRNGGSLTLSLDVSILALKGEDRTFVFDLIDKIEAYENSSAE